MILGRHMIVDLWGGVGAEPFRDMHSASVFMKRACLDAGATILDERWHHFGESPDGQGYGYTGVVVLSESHLSVHTWPERGYAAIDVFMCGDCEPRDALPGILEYYEPTRHEIVYLNRGKDDADGTLYGSG